MFVTWVGDHPPKHIHIYRNEKLVAKFDQESREGQDLRETAKNYQAART